MDTHMMEYYTVIRKIKILPFASTWMNLDVYNAKRNKSEMESNT